MSLESAVNLDLLVVAAGLAWILVSRRCSAFHPLVLYLVFHVLVVTTRALAIRDGAPTLFGQPSSQIAHAVNAADIALLSALLGSALAKRTHLVPGSSVVRGREVLQTGNRALVLTLLVCAPIGIYAMVRFSYIPGVSQATEPPNNYLGSAIIWPTLLMVLLIYRFGPKVVLLIPYAGLVVVIGLQGEQRFRALMPVLLLVFILLLKRGSLWPGMVSGGVIILLSVIYFPMDQLGAAAQQGDLTWSSARDIVAGNREDVAASETNDQQILDQSAAILAVAESGDIMLLGEPYLSILTLPVPRALWPEKPTLAGDIEAVAGGRYDVVTVGAVPTLAGDLVLNFGLLGLLVGPFLLLLWLTRLHDRAVNAGIGTPRALIYLTLAANLLQIYRDGLTSLPVFVAIHSFPVTLYCVLEWYSRRPKPSQKINSPIRAP